jgi:hypothetical protein
MTIYIATKCLSLEIESLMSMVFQNLVFIVNEGLKIKFDGHKVKTYLKLW